MAGVYLSSIREAQRLRQHWSMGEAGIATPVYVTPIALLHFDGANGSTAMVEETGKVCTAFGTAKIGTAQSVFGGASLDNTGGGRVQIADSTDFDFGTGPFLIEWRERPTQYTGAQNSFSRGYNLTGGMFLQTGGGSGSAYQTLYFVDVSNIPRVIIADTGALALNTTYARAIQRDASGRVDVFLDGVSVAFSAPSAFSQLPLGLRAPFIIGADSSGTHTRRAWFDEFQILRSAPYPASGYTPAATAFVYP